MFDTSEFFEPGKLTVLLSGTTGSCGKGKLGSFLVKYAKAKVKTACDTFFANSGHFVVDQGRKYFYQTFNSCAYQDSYDKLYIGPGASIELAAFWREIEESKIPLNKIGIHPLVPILEARDAAYERGEVNFEGDVLQELAPGTKAAGSTCHGCGSSRARRVLRKKDLKLAKDTPELKQFLCDVPNELMSRLDNGESSLCELAQGYSLSLMGRFYPHTTSRNISVAAGLDDMCIPPIYAGNVFLNFRTFPIRINSNKYIGDGNKFLIWNEVLEYQKAGKKFSTYEGNSGGWYSDQQETSWEAITKTSGSPVPIFETTSVTKLPRVCATWSKINLFEAIRANRTGGKIFISINFLNYVDYSMTGRRGGPEQLTQKCKDWLDENVYPVLSNPIFKNDKIELKCLGTGAETDDMIIL